MRQGAIRVFWEGCGSPEHLRSAGGQAVRATRCAIWRTFRHLPGRSDRMKRLSPRRSRMKIAVIGPGAIGTVVAAWLAREPSIELTVCARTPGGFTLGDHPGFAAGAGEAGQRGAGGMGPDRDQGLRRRGRGRLAPGAARSRDARGGAAERRGARGAVRVVRGRGPHHPVRGGHPGGAHQPRPRHDDRSGQRRRRGGGRGPDHGISTRAQYLFSEAIVSQKLANVTGLSR
jgi:hypothetical protein